MRICSAILVVLLTVGCAYHSPDAPSPTVTSISTTVPFSLTLGAAVGTGADAGHATVTAKVQNVNGVALSGVPVEFSTDVGTLSATQVVTGTNGTATTTITATDSASITATAGTLTTHVLVASQPVVAVPTPTPTPNPPPQPPPTAPLGPLSLTINATSAIVGASTIFGADIRNVSGAFSMVWDYGDGSTSTSISSTTAHTYAAAGTYRVVAVLRDDAGRSASATVNATVAAAPVPTPTPTPPPSISAALTCTAGDHTATKTFCNVAVTDQDGKSVTGQIGSDAVAWDWGDGTPVGHIGVLSNHQYTQLGSFTVTVTVDFGSARGSATKVLTIP